MVIVKLFSFEKMQLIRSSVARSVVAPSFGYIFLIVISDNFLHWPDLVFLKPLWHGESVGIWSNKPRVPKAIVDSSGWYSSLNDHNRPHSPSRTIFPSLSKQSLKSVGIALIRQTNAMKRSENIGNTRNKFISNVLFTDVWSRLITESASNAYHVRKKTFLSLVRVDIYFYLIFIE